MQRKLVEEGQACWLSNVSVVMQLNGDVSKDFWDQWWKGRMFETCMYTHDHHTMTMMTCMYKLRPSHALVIRKELENDFIRKWQVDVHRREAVRGEGLNKLRTYALFKGDFGLEPYIYLM